MHVSLKQGTVTATVFECEQMIKQIQLKIKCDVWFQRLCCTGVQSKCLPKESNGITNNHAKSSSAVRLAFTARDCKYFTPPCGCRENRLHYILETLNTQENKIFKGLTLVMANSNELVMIHWLRPKYKAVRFIISSDLLNI